MTRSTNSAHNSQRAPATASAPIEAVAGFPFRQWLDPDQLARIHEAQPDLTELLAQSWVDEEQALANATLAYVGKALAWIVMLVCVGLLVAGAL